MFCLQSSEMHYNIFLDNNLLVSKYYLGEYADIACVYQMKSLGHSQQLLGPEFL